VQVRTDSPKPSEMASRLGERRRMIAYTTAKFRKEFKEILPPQWT
jgi:hypothetical protein